MKPKRPSGLSFRGIPHDSLISGWIGPQGTPLFEWPGEMRLPVPQPQKTSRVWTETIFDPQVPFSIPADTNALVNLCASPEHYPLALSALDSLLRPEMVVLNHPRAVKFTRRDLAARALARIPFLQVPAVMRFVPVVPRDFMTVFDSQGFRYPVTLQPAACEEGRSIYTVNHPGDWSPLFQTPWADRVWIMTQAMAQCSPWRMRIGMAGQAIHAEVYSDTPSGSKRPAVPQDLIRALIAAVSKAIPLDVATLVVALEPDSPRFERIDAGLPVPAQGEMLALRMASQRVADALARPFAALLDDTTLWRTHAVRLPTLSGTATNSGQENGSAPCQS